MASSFLSAMIWLSEVPAWEEYFKSNGFTDCQLVQTFVWKHKDQKDQLIFACVPYPSRPDGALLAEAWLWNTWNTWNSVSSVSLLQVLFWSEQTAVPHQWTAGDSTTCQRSGSMQTEGGVLGSGKGRAPRVTSEWSMTRHATQWLSRYKASRSVLCLCACPLLCRRPVFVWAGNWHGIYRHEILIHCIHFV